MSSTHTGIECTDKTWNPITVTGGLRRRWANKDLNTFIEALEAFRTAMSF